MILYLDSSSIVSLYLLAEDRHEAVRHALDASDVAASSAFSLVEVRAALARALRDSRLTDSDYRDVLNDFGSDWPAFAVVPVSSAHCDRAGELAEKHALRAADALQLASVVMLRSAAGDEVVLSTWDDDLRNAGLAEGVRAVH